MNAILSDYYRCPPNFAKFALAGELSEESGYFGFGQNTICYGQSSSGFRAKLPSDSLYDALRDVTLEASTLRLPFDPAQVIDNLRCERYVANSNGGKRNFISKTAVKHAYYLVRPLMPVSVRRHFQRRYLRGWNEIPFPAWPVDHTVDRIFEKLLI